METKEKDSFGFIASIVVGSFTFQLVESFGLFLGLLLGLGIFIFALAIKETIHNANYPDFRTREPLSSDAKDYLTKRSKEIEKNHIKELDPESPEYLSKYFPKH